MISVNLEKVSKLQNHLEKLKIIVGYFLKASLGGIIIFNLGNRLLCVAGARENRLQKLRDIKQISWSIYLGTHFREKPRYRGFHLSPYAFYPFISPSPIPSLQRKKGPQPNHTKLASVAISFQPQLASLWITIITRGFFHKRCLCSWCSLLPKEEPAMQSSSLWENFAAVHELRSAGEAPIVFVYKHYT